MGRARIITEVTPCTTCGRPMRPNETTKTDYPDTVQHGGYGKCGTCREHERNRTDPWTQAHNIQALNDWIRQRRTRLAKAAA